MLGIDWEIMGLRKKIRIETPNYLSSQRPREQKAGWVAPPTRGEEEILAVGSTQVQCEGRATSSRLRGSCDLTSRGSA